MIRLPKLPALPDPEGIFSVIDKAGDAIETGLNIIDKVADKFDQAAQRFGPPEEKRSQLPSTSTIQSESPLPAAMPQPTEENSSKEQDIATACVPCAIGHFSRSAGALNEAMRFRGEGITSNEILDRIASALEEQNTLERFDLTPEKLQRTPQWEKKIAEEALEQSRKLRHSLEGIGSIEELERAAAETATYYKKINRQWYKERFRNLGMKKAETIAQRVGGEEP